MLSREPGDRRRDERLALSLPAVVRGHHADGTEWEETTTAEGVSIRGVSFSVERPVFMGQVLHLTLPLPDDLRQFDREAASYAIYAIVRNTTTNAGFSRVGVMFFGRNPPRGFEKKPTARYLLPSDMPRVPAESSHVGPSKPLDPVVKPETGHRRFDRYDIFVNFMLQDMDEWGTVLREELTVADNIGCRGARVMTAIAFKKGDVIFVQELGGPFAARAAVRGLSIGPDRLRRLHLEFLDGRTPEHLLPHR
jgi:hypothetical protein